jgi:hypothetical protein
VAGIQPWKNAAPSAFPRRYWTSFHYALSVLGEFVGTKSAAGFQWDSPHIQNALQQILNRAKVADELEELVALVEYRSGVMSEAMAERSAFVRYWQGVLMFDFASAPWTYDLVEIAAIIGQFQAMHYKRHFNRPRPSQYSPSLLPPIDPPGHPAFPSGHATEAYLMALCLAEVMPSTASTPANFQPSPGAPLQPLPDSSPLHRVAQRIARNREVLGLHFPSDSAAGKKLAEETFEILKACPTVKNVIAEAKKEWWP